MNEIVKQTSRLTLYLNSTTLDMDSATMRRMTAQSLIAG